MMKLFRQYQNYILITGGCLLMFVFLLEPALNGLTSSQNNPVIGEIAGAETASSKTAPRKLYLEDQRAAETDRQILARFSNLMLALAPQDATAWMLSLIEARQMGLSASDSEIDEVLSTLKLTTPEELSDAARKVGVPPTAIRAAIRDWLILQRHRELVMGLSHLPINQRMGYLSFASAMLESNNPNSINMAQSVLQSTQGPLRVSRTSMQRFIYDGFAQVKISTVAIPATKFIDPTYNPSEEELTELFQQHKDQLPGEKGPMSFGYRTPDQVRLEYLRIPLDRVSATIEFEEAEAVEYYESNPDEFRPQPEGDKAAPFTLKPAPQPYAQVRDRIVDRIRMNKAAALADQMIRAAQSILAEQLATIPEQNGYRNLPADFKPMPLGDVAAKLQERFKILPDVVVHDRWLTGVEMGVMQDLTLLQVNTARGAVPFVPYLFTTREFHADPDKNPLAILRLQVGVPTLPAIDIFTQARALARITATNPAATPATLDEVRNRVIADARLLSAYSKLAADKAQWLIKADGSPLAKFAEAQGTTVLEPPAFSRRQIDRRTGMFAVPDLSVIESDEAFVDDVFALAESTVKRELIEVAESDRRAAIPNAAAFALCIVRLEDFTPITLSSFNQIASGPHASSALYRELLVRGNKDLSNIDSLSVDALTKRLGYKHANN